jgi:hypothetical protein
MTFKKGLTVACFVLGTLNLILGNYFIGVTNFLAGAWLFSQLMEGY